MNRATVETRRIISAQVTCEEAARLEQLAIRHDRTLSAEIRRAVREHLERTHTGEETTP